MKETNKAGCIYRNRRWWCYLLLSIILAAFYLSVLWLGKHPNVGMEYKMYYITHELSDWPGYGGLSYANGTKQLCIGLKNRKGEFITEPVCRTKGTGWSKEQYEGSVNNKDTAYIYYVPKQQNSQSAYHIEVTDFQGNEPVEVYVNDTKVGNFTTAGSYDFQTESITADELTVVKFVTKGSVFTLYSAQLD